MKEENNAHQYEQRYFFNTYKSKTILEQVPVAVKILYI